MDSHSPQTWVAPVVTLVLTAPRVHPSSTCRPCVIKQQYGKYGHRNHTSARSKMSFSVGEETHGMQNHPSPLISAVRVHQMAASVQRPGPPVV